MYTVRGTELWKWGEGEKGVAPFHIGFPDSFLAAHSRANRNFKVQTV